MKNKNINKQILIGGMGILVLAAGCTAHPKAAAEEETEQGTEAFVMQAEQIEASTEHTSRDDMLQEYNALLQLAKDAEEIYSFVEKHIAEVGSKDADQMINGIIRFYADADTPDYERISKLENHLSEEMRRFAELMKAEQNSPAIQENKICVSLGELLKRTLQFEEQAVRYSDGITYPYVCQKYSQFLFAAITGLYDGTNVWSNCYLDTDRIHLQQKAIDEYGAFVLVHPESNMAIVLQEYLQVLNENEEEFNEKVQQYYGELEAGIREKFRIME